MSIAEKVGACNGVVKFLSKYEIEMNISGRKLNNLFLLYAKEKELEGFIPNNKRGYKGNYDPALDNACKIQSNFQQFASWVDNTFKKK